MPLNQQESELIQRSLGRSYISMLFIFVGFLAIYYTPLIIITFVGLVLFFWFDHLDKKEEKMLFGELW